MKKGDGLGGHLLNFIGITGGFSSARHPMPRQSRRFSTEGGLEIEKTDSTTVKTIAELYLLASVNFYRTAIITFVYWNNILKKKMKAKKDCCSEP